MNIKLIIFTFSLIVWPLTSICQIQTIQLGKPTTYDYVNKGIKTFTQNPTTTVTIPNEWEKKELFYLTIFYTWETSEDQNIDIVIQKKKEGELLYIDLDNNESITKDQRGYFFPYSDKKFEFWITDKADPKQKTGRLLLRLPSEALKDSVQKEYFMKSYFDSDGSLNSYWTNYWRRHNPDFDGSKYTYYFTERLNLRRGYLHHPQGKILIGLNDYSVNGLYDDKDDRIYLDLNNNGKLSYDERSEIFALSDTLNIDGNNFIITDVEKYGNYIQVKQIADRKVSHPFLTFSHKATNNSLQASGRLKSPFYNLSFESIDGNEIEIADYNNGFLLINFWGEWCGPCIAEIPELKKLRDQNGKKFKILSFLKAANYSKAIEIIENENLSWNHIKVTEDIERDFRILQYPTNYLINLEEKTFYQFGKLNYETIQHFIKGN